MAKVFNLAKAVAKVNDALENVPAEYVPAILQSAAALRGTSSHLAANGASGSNGAATLAQAEGGRKLSLVEFVEEKDPKTAAQKCVTYGVYLEQYDNAKLTREGVKKCFSRAKDSVPKNFNRDFDGAIKAGWIHEADGELYVTKKGVAAVNAGFGKAAPRGRAAPSRCSIAATRSSSASTGAVCPAPTCPHATATRSAARTSAADPAAVENRVIRFPPSLLFPSAMLSATELSALRVCSPRSLSRLRIASTTSRPTATASMATSST